MRRKLPWIGWGALIGAAAVLLVQSLGRPAATPSMTGPELLQAAEDGEIREILIENETLAVGRMTNGAAFEAALDGNEAGLIEALSESGARIEIRRSGASWGPWLAGAAVAYLVLVNLLLTLFSIGFPL